MARIEKIVHESVNIRTFVFQDPLSRAASPGQFVMIWLPGTGEFPMSLSLGYDGNKSSIVVKAMGEGSRALYNAKKDDLMGVRGPYGSSFRIPDSAHKILLVGGGTGIAPLMALAAFLESSEKKLDLVIGAKTKTELPFLSRSAELLGSDRVHATTDVGSFDFKGFAHEKVAQLTENFNFDLICACGPERMMYQVFQIAEKYSIPVQFSLERIMKCSIAICGSCCIQDLVLCRDGPVLNSIQLRHIVKEFGRFERDRTGKLVPKR
jgi:dihydroorotate dehydrogenase electron transfer subunit